jgi:DNA polymerase-1
MMQKPDYMLITRDLPGGTIRHDLDTEYKANRPESPDDFKRQIPIVHEVVNQLQLPNIGVPGYEADDVIATITGRLAQDDVQTFIVSSDKDLKQLLGKDVFILDPMKDEIYTEENFMKEF